MKNIIVILIFIIASINGYSQTVGLIIGDGQSNMAGVNDISSNVNLLNHKYYASGYSKIYDSITDNWRPMLVVPYNVTIGYHSQPNRRRNMNPFISIAYNVDSLATREYYFAMYAIGGSQLYQEVGLQDWNVNSTNEYYSSYIYTINRALVKLADDGLTVDTIYRIKYQGEGDASDLTKSNAFYQNESDFIDSLDASFNYPINHYLIEIVDTYTYSATVNGALSTLASERSNVTLYENTDFIYSGVHIDNASQIELGDSLYQLIENY